MPGVDPVANVMVDMVNMVALLSLKSTKGAARNQICKKTRQKNHFRGLPAPSFRHTPSEERFLFFWDKASKS